MQYVVTLLLCLSFVPLQPFRFEPNLGFLVSLLWLGLMISVGAQLLLYRLIRSSNLVNVPCLSYLMLLVTMILDYLIVRNAMPALAVVGMDRDPRRIGSGIHVQSLTELGHCSDSRLRVTCFQTEGPSLRPNSHDTPPPLTVAAICCPSRCVITGFHGTSEKPMPSSSIT